MSQIYVDPVKLREFAILLKEFSRQAEASIGGLNAHVGRLQNSWRDPEFEKFATHLRRTQGRLQAFASEAAKTVPALERDAEAMAAYLRVQFPD